MGYGCLLDFTVSSQLIRHKRLVSGFCSSGYDFAIPSSRLYLAVQTLGVAMGFVGNYAPCGLPPQTDGMPVILKKLPAAIRQTGLKIHIKRRTKGLRIAARTQIFTFKLPCRTHGINLKVAY